MPVVDLSRIGLEGIETANRTAESHQRISESQQQVAKSRFEVQVAEEDRAKMQHLNDLAAKSIPDILSGKAGVGRDPSGEMQSLAEPLERFGRIYMEGGATEQGMEFIKAASEVRKREQDIEDSTYTNHGKMLDNMTKGADLVSSAVGTARTQEDWDAGWLAVEESRLVPPELIKLFKSMEFSPEAVEIVNEQAMTAKERAEVDRLASNAEATARRDASLAADRLMRQDIARARLRNAEARTAQAASTGEAATAPKTADILAAERAIETQVFGGVSPTDPSLKDALKAGASAVALRTQAILRENRALTYEVALNRAVSESEALGDWQPWVDVQKVAGIEVGRTPIGAKYTPKGKTPETALPMPASKSKLVSGRFYDTPKGKARWTGSAFSTD